MCGADADGIAAALAAGEPVLRKRVALLPAAVRGELELVGDLAAMPDMAGVRARLAPLLTDAGLVVASARTGSALELRLWVAGEPAPPWGMLLAAPSPSPQLDELERGAATGLRVRLALPQLLAFLLPPTAVPEQPDLAGVLLDLFSGDVVIAGRGPGPLAGDVALGLTDAAGVRSALPDLCREPLGALGRVLRAEPGRCVLRLDLPPERLGHPLASAALALIRGRELDITVDRDLLRISSGSIPVGPGAPAIAALGGEPWQLRAWAADLAVPEGLPDLEALRRVADGVAGAALGVRLDETGFHLRVAVQPSDER